MNPNIPSYLPPRKNNVITNCAVCGTKPMLASTCCICGNNVCRNNCSYTIWNFDIANKPWLADKVGKNVCLNCMPKTTTADENYIKKVFAEIFQPVTTEGDYQDSNIINDTLELASNEKIKPIDETEKTNKMDSLIGSVLNDLSKHNNLKFDENGQLESNSLRFFANSLRQILNNAKLVI